MIKGTLKKISLTFYTRKFTNSIHLEWISEHTWKTRQSRAIHRDLPVANHALLVLMTAMMKHGINDLSYDTECKPEKLLDDAKKSDWLNEWMSKINVSRTWINLWILPREDSSYLRGRRAMLCIQGQVGVAGGKWL